MAINVGEGEDFEYDVDEASSWSEEDAQRIVDYLFARGGDVEGSDKFELIQKINENRGSEVAPTGEYDPASANVDQVKAWVGEDEAKAQEAYDAETAKDKPRQTLVDWLEENFNVS